MKIVRTSYRLPSKVPYQITACLKCLGLHYTYRQRRGQNRISFWKYYANKLETILSEAKERYNQMIVTIHPDKGGCPESCNVLNQIWQRIKLLFKNQNITI